MVNRLYLGGYTSEGGQGLGFGTFDAETGRVELDGWLDDVPDPSWLALAPDGRTLYAASELDPDGRIAAIRVDAGRPVFLNSEPTGGAPAHVCVHPSGEYLFTANYGSGTVAVHPIAADGSVRPASHVVQHPAGRDDPHAHQVVVADGRIIAVDLGADAVFVYDLDGGRLTERARVPVHEGAGPRHVEFHPEGRYAYLAGELDSTLTVCTWRNGELTLDKPVRTTTTDTENHPAEVLVSPDGRFVYVGNRGDNSTAVFATDGPTIQLVDTVPCGGDWPRHTAVDPSGRWLFVANQRSGEVVWFERDAQTGLPTREAGRLAAPGASHVLFA